MKILDSIYTAKVCGTTQPWFTTLHPNFLAHFYEYLPACTQVMVQNGSFFVMFSADTSSGQYYSPWVKHVIDTMLKDVDSWVV
jgi:hypothetical protein